MPSPSSESPDESFFNDLAQQPGDAENPSPTHANGEAQNDSSHKPKRIACVLCRKRKLKCDGTRPSCGTCRRLSHDCAYDEVRKKSGPKRGYVKLLEARLQQVETLLKNQESPDASKDASRPDSTTAYVATTLQQPLPNANDFLTLEKAPVSISPGPDAFRNGGANPPAAEGEFPWEMIGLGLDEPLPPQDVMDDLYQIYFSKIHQSFPVIHKPRFMAAMNLAPHMRPPVCLRYIMWTLAAGVTDKYDALQEHFYQRARKYAQSDEMKGHGESTITLAHCQAWALMGAYEFKQMYFPRAWLSAGRATRLAQMMQLHRLDGVGLDVKQCLPPPKDWTEREERRRTFWLAYCIDRYASIGTGWPMTFDERDILTNLPASDDAFEKSKPMPTGSLEQALTPSGIQNLQSFGGIVLMATLFGRNLLHLHRPGPDDRDDDLEGGFWTRHRAIENILSQTSLGLPDHLRVPNGLSDPNTVFMNMKLHTSVICLHQAAIFKADKYRLPAHVGNDSKIRCVTAASEIASLMRLISHLDLGAMNPFISFCVYVAARVFVQYLRTRPNDQPKTSSLQFLLQAMQALRRRNPLTESFLVQLDLDLESAGLQNLQAPYRPSQYTSATCVIPVGTNSVTCSPVFEIRETPNAAHTVNAYGNVEPSITQTGARPQTTLPPFRVPKPCLDTQNAGFVPSQTTATPAFTLADSGDMDLSPDTVDHPSPATSNSRTTQSQSQSNSTSHSSYSPSTTERLAYRPSPRMAAGIPPLQQHPHTSSNSTTNFFTATDDLFSANIYPNGAGGPMNADSLTNGFILGNEWDIGAMSGAGMGEAGWNQMLDDTSIWGGRG